MADIKDLADGRSALLKFDPRRIKIKPCLNARDLTSPQTRAWIEELKGSLRANGFLNSRPLEVYRDVNDDIILTAGHCRLTAVLELLKEGVIFEKVPCLPEPKGTSELDRIFNQNLDNDSLHLSPFEQGTNVKRAVALGSDMATIAKRLGKTEQYLNILLGLQAAPQAVQEMVKSGSVSASLASKMLRDHGGAGASETLKGAVEVAKKRGRKRALPRDMPKKERQADIEDITPPLVKKTAFGKVRVSHRGASIELGASIWRAAAEEILNLTDSLGVQPRDATEVWSAPNTTEAWDSPEG